MSTNTPLVGYPHTGWNSSIGSKPFVYVTPNGPYDGGDFGPNSIVGGVGTSTSGIQEAINAVAEGGVVYVDAVDESSGSGITIGKNISLVAWRNPRTTGGDSTASILPRLAGLTVDSTSEQLNSVYVEGMNMAGTSTTAGTSLQINATSNINHATTFERCLVAQGITISGNTLCDFASFHACELRQIASGNTILFNLTNTSNSGGGGINQLFIDEGSLLDIEGPSGGTGIFFNGGSQSQTNPVVNGCSIVAKGTLTKAVLFEINDAIQMEFDVKCHQTEFHCPTTMIECLLANQTRAYNLCGLWDAPFGTFNSGSNQLFNITATAHTPTDLSNVIVRGYDLADGATWGFGTLSGVALATGINVMSFNPFGLAVTTPGLPGGTGSANSVTNTNLFPVMIFQSGMSGTELTDTQQNGSGSLANDEPASLILQPGWKIFYATTVATHWKWVGLHV